MKLVVVVKLKKNHITELYIRESKWYLSIKIL